MNDKTEYYTIWNQVPVDYYQQGIQKNLLQRIWHNHKINVARSLIDNLQFKNCLDIGCASGHMVSRLAQFYPNKQFYGVDIFDKAINFANKHYPGIKFQKASTDKLPFTSKFFDLIVFYETIEHVEDPQASLLEIKRVLSPSGNLILAMDSGSILFRLIWCLWEKTVGAVWQGAHLHPYKHQQLQELITDKGFKIKKKIFSHFGMEVVFVLTK